MPIKETGSEVSKASESRGLDFDADKLIGSEAKESKPETAKSENAEPVDPDKLIEPTQRETHQTEVEQSGSDGGSYREVKKSSDGTTHEVHHMPAADVNGLDFYDGPAIKMEKDDHRETASCGSSKDARDYRAQQAEYIREGNFKEAMQMDIDDIHEKFGDKYDDAIDQMISYATEKGYI